jgi:alpha-L-fucosidase 2
LVSARRERNATTSFKIVATRSGRLRVRDNFGGRPIKWSRADVVKVGDDFEISLKAAETLEATLPRPEQIPPAPADVARPVSVNKDSK